MTITQVPVAWKTEAGKLYESKEEANYSDALDELNRNLVNRVDFGCAEHHMAAVESCSKAIIEYGKPIVDLLSRMGFRQELPKISIGKLDDAGGIPYEYIVTREGQGVIAKFKREQLRGPLWRVETDDFEQRGLEHFEKYFIVGLLKLLVAERVLDLDETSIAHITGALKVGRP